VAEAGLSVSETVRRHDEATLAETRAQLARLREAAEAVDEADASGDDTVLGVAIRNLRDALSTPGPTLADIRRAAQVEVLREMAGNLTQGWASEWLAGWLRQRADDMEAGRG